MGGLEDRWSLVRRLRTAATSEPAETPAAAPEPVPRPPGSPAAPLPRPASLVHHWLSVLVARPGPAQPVPVAGARVVARPYPRGSAKPAAPIAHSVTAADGTTALLLAPGRYAISARDGDEGRSVTVSLEHAGRATILLESRGRRIALQVEVADERGEPAGEALVEAFAMPSNALAGRTTTDFLGVAVLDLPPGAYEVRVGETAARTYVETDTLLRLTTRNPAASAKGAAAVAASGGRHGDGVVPEHVPLTRYAQRAREATSYAAPFDVGRVRDDIYN